MLEKLIQDRDADIAYVIDSRSIDNEGNSSCSSDSDSDVNAHSKAKVDQPLSYPDFLEYVLNALVEDKKWMNVVSVAVDWRHIFVAKEYGSAEKLLEAATDSTVEGKELQLIVSFRSGEDVRGQYIVFYQDKDEYTRYTADKALGRIKGNRDEFKKFCESQLLPIRDSDENGVLPTKREYVQVHGVNEFDNLDSNIQNDKSYALVVAGESGSGKSVFSCLESMERGFIPLYMLLRMSKNQRENEGEDKKGDEESNKEEKGEGKRTDVSEVYARKPESEFPHIHKFLQGVLNVHKEKSSNHIDVIDSLKTKLDVSRNKWAREILKQAFKKFCEGDANARSWSEGCWSSDALPSKVALILDEATDIDLVEGLIDTVRQTYREMNGLVKEQIILVLVGTGLDLIRDGNQIGTNPAYSRLIRMKGPDLQHLEKIGVIKPEISRAVSNGLFSRVLQTNSRMLFRGILPVLRQGFHSVDGNFDPQTKKRRYKERLKAIASFGPLMDYGVRFFVTKNIMGDLSSNRRDELLAESFVYHLSTAIRPPLREHATVSKIRQIEREKVKELKKPSNEIFEVGLAVKSGTSAALKYMSCFGLTCPIRPSFGNELEELTALHYQRLMEIQGYRSQRVTLRYAWPPMSNKRDDNITAAVIKDLKKKLAKQSEMELPNLSIGQEDGRECIVFSQGTASAQGGVVLALLFDNKSKTGELVTIQCKHHTTMASAKKTKSWWASLGISFQNNDSSPKVGKAGYSYTGLEALRSLLETRLQQEYPSATISLGDRIMACSFREPPNAEFPIPDYKRARVWFREMLEPTISTFQLRDAEEEEEEEEN